MAVSTSSNRKAPASSFTENQVCLSGMMQGMTGLPYRWDRDKEASSSRFDGATSRLAT